MEDTPKKKVLTANERAVKFLESKVERLSKMPQTPTIKLSLERAQDQLKKAQNQ